MLLFNNLKTDLGRVDSLGDGLFGIGQGLQFPGSIFHFPHQNIQTLAHLLSFLHTHRGGTLTSEQAKYKIMVTINNKVSFVNIS